MLLVRAVATLVVLLTACTLYVEPDGEPPTVVPDGAPAEVDAGPIADAAPPDAPPEPTFPTLFVGVHDRAIEPQLVIDVHGRAHMAWVAGGRLHARAYAMQNGWDETVLLDGPVNGTVTAFALGGGQTGDVVLVWQATIGSRTEVWSRRYEVSGLGWRPPERLSAVGASAAGSPAATACCGAALWAAWAERGTTPATVGVWVRRHASGAWDAALRLDAGAEDVHAHRPRIAASPSGTAVVAWLEDPPDGARTQVWASRFEAATQRWSAPIRVDDHPHGDAVDVQLAIDAEGDAMVTWSASWPGLMRVWTRELRRSGPGDVVAIDGGLAGWSPQVARDHRGGAVVVWRQRDPLSGSYLAARSYTDGEWGLITPLGVEYGTSEPRLAMSMEGEALVVWHRQLEVEYVRKASDGTWSAPARADDGVVQSGAIVMAAAAAGDAGDLQAFWSHIDDGGAVEPSLWARILRQPPR